MCGRYAITLPPEAMRALFRYVETPNFPPRFNVAPTQPVPIVRIERGGDGVLRRHFRLMRWGFVPAFVKDPRKFPLIINARAEGIETKPSFRAALIRRRCLFIADGYYEWRRARGSGKPASEPFLIRRADRMPFGIAGLHETWSDPSGGEIDTACLITTPASRTTAPVHERMPVIIDPDRFEDWLDGDRMQVGDATRLLVPAPESEFDLTPIGTAVNKVANDGPEVQEPLAPSFPSLADVSGGGAA